MTSNNFDNKTPWIIIGGGGQGKVIADIVIKNGFSLKGFLDDTLPIDFKIMDFCVLGKTNDALMYNDNHYFIIGIGSNDIRRQIASKYKLNYKTLIHPTATIATNVKIAEGSAVHAGATINPCCNIKKHCIINTGAIVEHDNNISDYVHISPAAALGGTVNVGTLTHIGIGSTIKNNINICSNAIVGAGAVVVKDIKEQGTYVGVPARKI